MDIRRVHPSFSPCLLCPCLAGCCSQTQIFLNPFLHCGHRALSPLAPRKFHSVSREVRAYGSSCPSAPPVSASAVLWCLSALSPHSSLLSFILPIPSASPLSPAGLQRGLLHIVTNAVSQLGTNEFNRYCLAQEFNVEERCFLEHPSPFQEKSRLW